MPVFRTVTIDEDDRNGFVFQQGKRLILEEGVTLADDLIPLFSSGIALDASQGIADRSYLIKGDIAQVLASGISIGMDIIGKDADITVTSTGSVRSEDIGIAIEGDAATLVIAKGGVVEGAGTGIDLDLADDAELTVNGRLLSAQTALSISAEAVVVIIDDTGVVKGDIVAEGDTRQSVTNHGKIVGDIAFGDGNDFYVGFGGRLEGQVAGGAGNDGYAVDNAGTAIVEAEDGGTDAVFSRVTFTLGDNLEILSLIGKKSIDGFGNELNNFIEGNRRGNRIEGGDGVDELSGASGADRLFGGEDDDELEGGKGADQLDGGDDFDTANYAASTAGVIVNLATGEGQKGDAAGDTLIDIENITGSSFADKLTGDSGDNFFGSGAGSDILKGLDGADVFHFAKKGGVDIIKDFEHGTDRISLDADLGFDDFTDLSGRIVQGDGGIADSDETVITLVSAFRGKVQIHLQGVDATTLDADDFLF